MQVYSRSLRECQASRQAAVRDCPTQHQVFLHQIPDLLLFSKQQFQLYLFHLNLFLFMIRSITFI